jgi:hypothetical protein
VYVAVLAITSPTPYTLDRPERRPPNTFEVEKKGNKEEGGRKRESPNSTPSSNTHINAGRPDLQI